MPAAAAALTGSRWPDLLPELLGLVLSRVPSHADRVRLRAVCRPWRSGARTPLAPPLLPWAALRDGTFLSLPDGAVHRMPVPDDVAHRVSTGSMLFLVHRDGRCSLMHPHSGDTTPQRIDPCYLWPPLPLIPRRFLADNIRKVVVSDHMVAIRTRDVMNFMNVAIYARGGAGAGSMSMKWVPPDKDSSPAADIALFQGKLYVLTATLMYRHYELHVLDVVDGGVRSEQCIRTTRTRRDRYSGSIECRFYLVVSGDRLLMVEQTIARRLPKETARSRFEVLEAADLSSGHGRWSKVDTLMGRALFISEGCSESLPAGGIVGAREDCIYFMSESVSYCSYRGEELQSGVYDMREGTTVAPLPPLETLPATLRDGPWSPTWLFPVET